MDSGFRSILAVHENEDDNTDERAFYRLVLEEFSNGAQILAEAQRHGMTPSAFKNRGMSGFDLPFIPMRTAKKFSIKKHTLSQHPYFHAHDFYEFIYVHSGLCRQNISGREIELKSGQACLVCPGCTHLIERCANRDIIIKLVIPEALFAECADYVADTAKGFRAFEVPVSAQHFIMQLLNEELYNDSLHERAVESYLILLFTELERENCRKKSAFEATVKRYIADNIKTATLNGFASELGYTACYTSRIVNLHTGKKFKEILAEMRISKAIKLLFDTSLTVEDVAEETGYATACGFYKQFTARCGMTPAEYRRTMQ